MKTLNQLIVSNCTGEKRQRVPLLTLFFLTFAISLLFCTMDKVYAHGDQEMMYLGSECRLRGDFEREAIKASCPGTAPNTPWRNLLGVSVFGFVANLHTCGVPKHDVPTERVPDFIRRNAGDMVLTCPIPRGAIRKGTGLRVSIKAETTLKWDQNDNQNEKINKNFRCELLNINQQGDGATQRDTTGSSVVTSQLLKLNQSKIATIGLSLSQSNASSDFDARGAGGYVINCILPGQRNGIPSRLIQYTVQENN